MDSKHVYAVADFRGEQGEISFKRGSKIIVVAQHNNGWWLGRNEVCEGGRKEGEGRESGWGVIMGGEEGIWGAKY